MPGNGAEPPVTDTALSGLGPARIRTLRAIASLTQPQLDFSPREGRWSIGETVDHLLLAEALYRGEIGRLVELRRAGQQAYIRRSFADMNGAPFHLPDMVLSWLEVPLGIANRFIPDVVRDFLTEHVIVPVRNPDQATPRPRRPGADLRRELLSSLEQTRTLVLGNADLDFSQMVSEHPLTGASDIRQMLTFLASHERRHHAQMDRVRSDPRFPRS